MGVSVDLRGFGVNRRRQRQVEGIRVSSQKKGIKRRNQKRGPRNMTYFSCLFQSSRQVSERCDVVSSTENCILSRNMEYLKEKKKLKAFRNIAIFKINSIDFFLFLYVGLLGFVFVGF